MRKLSIEISECLISGDKPEFWCRYVYRRQEGKGCGIGAQLTEAVDFNDIRAEQLYDVFSQDASFQRMINAFVKSAFELGRKAMEVRSAPGGTVPLVRVPLEDI